MRLPFTKSPLDKYVEREIEFNENTNSNMKMDLQRTVHIIASLAGQKEIEQNNYDNIMNVVLYIVCKAMNFTLHNFSPSDQNDFDPVLFDNFLDSMTEELKNVYSVGYYKLGSSPFVELMILRSIDLFVDFYIAKKYDFKNLSDIENLIKQDTILIRENGTRIQTANLLVNIYFSIIVCIISKENFSNLKNVKKVLKKIDEHEIYKSCLVFAYKPNKTMEELRDDVIEMVDIFEFNYMALLESDKF